MLTPCPPLAIRRLCLCTVFASLSLAQAPPKKTSSAQTKPDTWQKSKECAVQAEKVVEAFRTAATVEWQNHYSPKYERCFLKVSYMYRPSDGGGKDVPMFSYQLIDAFERSRLANSASVGPTGGICNIDEKPVDCAKAEAFIAEHLKN